MVFKKGKSALIIFDRHANLKYKYGNRKFWCRGYYVDSVGRNEKKIKEYIFISLYIIMEFVASHGLGYAKIIQCLVYGGFGLVSVLMGAIFKNKNTATYLNQSIHFCAMLIYFIFAGLYLKWFNYDFSIVISVTIFVGIYLLIAYIFYLYEKNMIKKSTKSYNN